MAERESVAAQKTRRRAEFRAIRAGLGAERMAAASAAICTRLAALVRDHRARTEALTVSAFWPLPGEVDLRPLLHSLVADGVTVALPVVASRPGEAPRLIHRAMDGSLVQGRFGVMEPSPASPLVAPEAVEVAIVPALALTREGVRLGYGGGYYDAFLAETPALRVGVVVAACLAESLPHDDHDALVEVIVTERETTRVPGEASSSRNRDGGLP